MAKDASQGMRLCDLTDAEIERIEAHMFCSGGPPDGLTTAIYWRASLREAAAPSSPHRLS